VPATAVIFRRIHRDELMIARCHELLANPPGADWQPVMMIGEK